MVVEAETGSDEQAKYKANAHACRRLWAVAKKLVLPISVLQSLPREVIRSWLSGKTLDRDFTFTGASST
jgi:hypothetical protein